MMLAMLLFSLRPLLGTLVLTHSALLGACADDVAPAEDASIPLPESKFLRFVENDDEARLETSIAVYEDDQGRRVDLVGAVHIGEPSYYDMLNRVFPAYDSVLYEMVAEKGTKPEPGREATGFISIAQRLMTDVLKLEFQLDGVDYKPDNFVHADLDPGTFARLQEESGDSILKLMLRVAMQNAGEMEDPQQASADQMQMLVALFAKDKARSLKYVIGKQFGQLEKLAAGFESGPNGEPSVLIGRRNEECMRVMRNELEAGKKRLAIFYGAAHLPDFERRLVRRYGFKKVRETWVAAWTIEGSKGK